MGTVSLVKMLRQGLQCVRISVLMDLVRSTTEALFFPQDTMLV